ncbi:MAG TPA: HAD hydrolase family protein [Arachnia sp.]|nr:HAD hydrolase family protein [Arachnia sp.]
MATLAFDLDGTIYIDKRISPENAAAINRWRAAGNRAIISTGRSIAAIRAAWADSGIEVDGAVAFTGGAVTDGSFTPRWSSLLDQTLVMDVYELLRDECVRAYVTDLDGDWQFIDNVADTSDLHIPSTPILLESIADKSVVGLPIFVPDDADRARLAPQLRGLIAGRADLAPNLGFLDLVPIGASKGTGVRRFQEMEPLDGDVLYTIGDSWNDIPMHVVADHATGFSYSPPEVLDVVDRVVDHLHELVDAVLGNH